MWRRWKRVMGSVIVIVGYITIYLYLEMLACLKYLDLIAL